MPDIFAKKKPATGSGDEHHKSYSTQCAYDIYLNKWVLPRWRPYRLSEVKAVDVEAWLKTLPIGARQQSQNQKSDECSVFSRDPLGVDGTKPDQECTSKCKADEDTGCSYARRDHGTTQEIARTSSNGGRARCLHRLATWRIDWTPMGRRGFRESRYSCSTFGRDDGSRHSEDRSFSKRCASRRHSCGISSQAATDQPIQPRKRLGFCFAHKKGEATALARHSLATIWETGGQGGGDQETSCVSHLPAHVYNLTDSEQRGHKGSAGTSTPCEQSGHARFVRSGWNAGETGSTKQTSTAGTQRRRGTGLTGPNWTMREIANSPQVHERNGGDDGTRTRGLCRDRAAF